MYVLFDIGGTKTRVAVSEDLRTILHVIKFDTPPLYVDGIAAIHDAIKKATGGKKVLGMAGGIRGPLNHEKTGIVSETKLIDWVGRPITRDLGKEFNDIPVLLENDTAIVGLGEVTHGAGKGYVIVAYLTVSTGVGGARFVDGVLDRTSVGFEIGHQILDIDQTLIRGHVAPTLENLVSGTALEKRRGVKPYEIPQKDHVWDELAYQLAVGLKNTVVYWSPDIIVLGGSMIVGDPRILLEPTKAHTKALLGSLMPCPHIVDATLKDEGGLYGAIALLNYKLNNIK